MKIKDYILRILSMLLILTLLCGVLVGCAGNDDDTIPFNKGATRVIAHRGLSGLAVENSEAAFVAAGERSYYGIETDVRRTADGEFVISHDSDLERLSGEKISVEESTLAELKSVSLYDESGKKDGSVRILTLEEYILISKRYGKQAILEFKSSFTEEEIGEIVARIDALGYLECVTFISFDYDELLTVRKYSPSQPVQYLFSSLDDGLFERMSRDRISAAIKYTYVNRSVVERFHAVGLEVNTWTVDSVAIAEQMCRMGVDYITTNILE